MMQGGGQHKAGLYGVLAFYCLRRTNERPSWMVQVMTPLALVLTLDTSDIVAAWSSSYRTSADASYSLAVWAHDLVYSNLVCLGAKKCTEYGVPCH